MKSHVIFCFLTLSIFSCVQKANKPDTMRFETITSAVSGIEFTNTIVESDTFNYYTYPYLYMGGGVAIGDINNDGLQDIFFTGNMVSNKLYLNKGNMKFEDITKQANVGGDNRWYTGVTMADVNNDGWIDIYLSVSGKNTAPINQLLINNGNLTFTESAAKYGIDDSSPSIQSTFFDYNNDGYLDLFVANYPQFEVSQGNYFYSQMMKENKHVHSGHLYCNQKDGTFKDVTAASNVQNLGLTLGVVAADFNNDGWSDLYLSNDFNVPDFLYLNNQGNGFKEVLKESTQHTAMFGMGIDAADFNNDGLIDLAQVDMTSSDHKRSKTNMASMSPSTFYEAVNLGFHYQYMHNAIQLNNGIFDNNIPVFSEVSQMMSAAKTDWSWSALLADFDNDGAKDLFVTNGTLRDVNNNDANIGFDKASFFGRKQDYKQLPSTPLSNYMYRSNGEFSFENKAKEWGLDDKGFSNGVAYADLDNDGDLDLVVNNINSKATLYQNQASTYNNYLRVKVVGPNSNPLGIGAKIKIYSSGEIQGIDHTLTRGFQSSVEPIVHFGTGQSRQVDSLIVQWQDGKLNIFKNVATNQTIKVFHKQAIQSNLQTPQGWLPKFTKTTSNLVPFEHLEDEFDDFKNEPLLPHKNSTVGPCSATGDINKDGLTDIFLGNARNAPGKLLVQQPNGGFKEISGPWQQDSVFEDTGCLLMDLDSDNDLDLYIVSGGNDPFLEQQHYQDRVYINVNGNFVKSDNQPKIFTSGKVVLPLDYDDDGDQDLFIGGRIIPGKYPFPANSTILKNNGKTDDQLIFEHVDSEETAEFKELGLVTAGIWQDLDDDGKNELIITGEWMGIEIFSCKDGTFTNVTASFGIDNQVGWWRSVITVDVDNDGDLDIVGGNLGLNYKYNASSEHPFNIYANDFDKNGSPDIVLSYEKEGVRLPLRGRQCSSEQIPGISQKFKTYESFANASLEEIYGEEMLEAALHYEAVTFAHCWFENKEGKFVKHELPRLSQISSVSSILSFNYNGDEYPDLLIGGNLYDAEVETTRNDASVGLVLIGKGAAGYEAIHPNQSGLMVNGEIKAIHPIYSKQTSPKFIFTKNNDSIAMFHLQKQLIN